MTRVLRELIGAPQLEVASEMFHALLAQNTRLPVMRALLQNTTANAGKSADYDAILDEFKRLNDQRNQFIHGYWYTHAETDHVYLCKSNQDAASALAGGKRVTAADLVEFQKSCGTLMGRAFLIRAPRADDNTEDTTSEPS